MGPDFQQNNGTVAIWNVIRSLEQPFTRTFKLLDTIMTILMPMAKAERYFFTLKRVKKIL